MCVGGAAGLNMCVFIYLYSINNHIYNDDLYSEINLKPHRGRTQQDKDFKLVAAQFKIYRLQTCFYNADYSYRINLHKP